MSEPLILSFDMGTQSARALLINSRGDIVHKAQKIYEKPYFSKQPGWAEQRADFYWESLCETSRELRGKAGTAWDDIIAVTCATIRDTCLCLDKDKKPLRDVILWLDDRKTTDLSPIPSSTAMLLKVAGMLDGVALQRAVSHCNWIAKYEREVWEKTDKFVLISAWLNYKFCGNLADSIASTVGHIPFDAKIKTWMKKGDMRRIIFEVENNKLCDLVEPGTQTGTITTEAAEAAGIKQGLPFIVSGSDKSCETLGLSCLSPDKAALSFGTTATVQLTTQFYMEPLPYMPPYLAIAPGTYNPEVEIYRGYWLLSWFKREFAAKETAEAEKLGIHAEKLLDSRLKEINPGCDGLIMQPYFTPGVDMPYAKGAIIGFSSAHTRIHLYRAIIEGINFALMDGLRGMEKRGKLRVKSIYVAGGGSQSDEICQITASMFGLPVYRIQTFEATGIGSAMTAFKTMGVFASYEAAAAAMSHIKDEFLPDAAAHSIYEDLYQRIFEKIFDKLSPLYQDIDKIILKGNKHGASLQGF